MACMIFSIWQFSAVIWLPGKICPAFVLRFTSFFCKGKFVSFFYYPCHKIQLGSFPCPFLWPTICPLTCTMTLSPFLPKLSLNFYLLAIFTWWTLIRFNVKWLILRIPINRFRPVHFPYHVAKFMKIKIKSYTL